jgi:hypothetical protein
LFALADAFIDSIKLYAWEFAFIRKILFVRNEQELKMLKKIGLTTVRVSEAFVF